MTPGLKRSRTLALVVALGSWNSVTGLAEDRFIVQPKYRPSGRAAPTLSVEASQQAEVPVEPNQMLVEQTNGTETSSVLCENLTEKSPRPIEPQDFGSASLIDLQSPQQSLRWVARGSTTAVAVQQPANQPLEFENKTFVAPAADKTPARVDQLVPPEPAEEFDKESAQTALASLVSTRIMASGADQQSWAAGRIDAPPGWQAIGQELSQRIASCEGLLNRQAYYSARGDAEAAGLYLVRLLDLMSNQYSSEPAWHAALRAMVEAEDFSSSQRLPSDSDFLRRVILSHETPVLKACDVSKLAPLAAAQHYRQYAEEKLIEAAQEHPWASEVVYALGRTYQAQADATSDGSQQALRWRAVTLYRSACAIAPRNSVAANQLGFVLLQMDRPADAREALLASIQSQPTAHALENLVEASRRLGDRRTCDWAMNKYLALQHSNLLPSNAPAFIEVDPKTFAAISPYSIGPNPRQPTSNPATPVFQAASMPMQRVN